jgi:hypothetical protein
VVLVLVKVVLVLVEVVLVLVEVVLVLVKVLEVVDEAGWPRPFHATGTSPSIRG